MLQKKAHLDEGTVHNSLPGTCSRTYFQVFLGGQTVGKVYVLERQGRVCQFIYWYPSIPIHCWKPFQKYCIEEYGYFNDTEVVFQQYKTPSKFFYSLEIRLWSHERDARRTCSHCGRMGCVFPVATQQQERLKSLVILPSLIWILSF